MGARLFRFYFYFPQLHASSAAVITVEKSLELDIIVLRGQLDIHVGKQRKQTDRQTDRQK